MSGIEDFFESDILDQRPSSSSILSERFLRASIPLIGLEQIYEIILEGYSDRFWVCRICNVADSTLNTADAHVHSREHVLACFKAYNIYEKYEEAAKNVSDKWVIEYKFLLDYINNVGLLSPSAYCLPNSASDLAKTFGISLATQESKNKVEEVTDNICIVHCDDCKEVYFSDVDEEKAMKARHDHHGTPQHQECMFINSYINSFTLTKKDYLPNIVMAKDDSDFLISAVDDVAYGPPIGFEHCISFGNSEYFCSLCFCIVRCDDVQEHFSCEAHVERFLRSLTPSNYVNIEYDSQEKRRAKLEAELKGQLKDIMVSYHWEAGTSVSTFLRQIVRPEVRKLHYTSIEELPDKFMLCKTCNVCLKPRDSWEEHIFEDAHFEKLVAKQSVQRDPRSFIYEKNELPVLPRKQKAHWYDCGAFHNVQNFCEYGLDLIYRDVVAGEFICTCCYERITQDDPQAVVLHARSLSHIKTALCILNPALAVRILLARNETELKAMLLDYLQHRNAPIFEMKFRVFDPNTAFILNSRTRIPRVLLQLSVTDPTARDSFVVENNISNVDGSITLPENSDYLCLTTALECTNLLLTRIDHKIVVFWCPDCNTSFSVYQNDLKSIWTDHMLTELHWIRSNQLKANSLGLNSLLDITSQYQPTVFDQTGAKKKTPWQWNDEKKCFQYVLNNKLHFHDVFQQNNFQGVNRIFCSLCCDAFELSGDALTAHIGSMKHLIFYMHKYYSSDIMKMEDILVDNAKDIIVARLVIRDYIADKLKVSENKNSKVLFFDARPSACSYHAVQQIVDNENTLAKFALVKVVTKINSLQSATSFNLVSLHNLSSVNPVTMNIRQNVMIHLVLKNVLSESIADKRPVELDDLVKGTATSKSKIHLPTGPVTSRIKIGFNGVVELPAAAIAPVPPPNLSLFEPVPAPPVKLEVKPTPMDISDDEDGLRKRSRSRTFSPDDRYADNRNRRRHRRSRSRSPFAKRSMRSDDPREVYPRASDNTWRSHERSSSRRDPKEDSWASRESRDSRSTRDDRGEHGYRDHMYTHDVHDNRDYRDPRSDRDRRDFRDNRNIREIYNPREDKYRDRTPPLCLTPPPRSSRYEEHSRRSPPQRHYKGSSRSPPLPQTFYEQQERSLSRNSLSQQPPRWMDPSDEYSNHSMPAPPEMGPYQSPVPDFVQPPPGFQQFSELSGPPKHNDPRYDQIMRNLPVITPETKILPTVDLTKPPPTIPSMPFGMPGVPPPGMPPPGFPTGINGMPPAMVPPVVVDQTELVKKAKMELYNRDLQKITSRSQLVEYLIKQSADPIPSSDPPLLFNEVLKTKKAIIGADQLAQVICYGEPDYETYLCQMCQYWTTVNEIFKHLKDETHRLNYMNKSYKLQHAKIMVEERREARDRLLYDFSLKISSIEGQKLCNTRMRTIMNASAMKKIWPDFLNYVDNSWKLGEGEDEEEYRFNKEAAKHRRSPSPRSRDRSGRSGRENERLRDSDRSRDKRRIDEDRSRRRSRSPDRSRRRTPPKKEPSPNRPIWEKQIDMFRQELEMASNNLAMNYEDVNRNQKDRIATTLRPVASKAADNRHAGEAFDEEYNRHFAEKSPPKPEEPQMSAAERRRREQEAEMTKLKEFQKYVSALILIRQEAMDNKGVDREAVERICKQAGVDPDTLFSDEILDDAAKRIGSNSIYTLMAIAHHYHHPSEPPPKILQETDEAARPPHAATLLTQIGLDKGTIANLLRKVAMSKYEKDNDNLSESSDKNPNGGERKTTRGKRGGVKQRLREMQAKVRELEAQAHGRPSYPAGYEGSSGFYNEPGCPPQRPRIPGGAGPEYYDQGYPPTTTAADYPGSGYYQDEYYYGHASEHPPPRYNYNEYSYPQSSAVTRTPGYPSQGLPPGKHRHPGPDVPHGYEGYDAPGGNQWPPPRKPGNKKQAKSATGGNTVPLGPSRFHPQPGMATSRMPAPTASTRGIYDSATYEYQGYQSSAAPPSQPTHQPPQHQRPAVQDDFTQDWDEAADALSNLFG